MTTLSIIITGVYSGHVIFEMSCGFELTTIVPGDYNSIRDGKVKEVLKAIFSRDDEGDFTSSINEVNVHSLVFHWGQNSHFH